MTMEFFSKVSSLLHILNDHQCSKTSMCSYSQIFQALNDVSGTDTISLSWLEKTWAAWYIYMNNDTLATGLLFFLWHELMYFGRCLPWFLIDRITFFKKWKIQDKIPSDKEQWECFKLLVKLHFLVEALPIWLFHPFCTQLGISVGVPFPSFLTMFVQICIFFVCEDMWHYWSHRLLHQQWFYRNIHKQHHRYAAPFGLAAEYAHPVEVMVLGFGTIGFPVLYAYAAKIDPTIPQLHLFTLVLWIALRLFQAVDSHSGYNFPWSLHSILPFWAGADHHDDHHHYFVGNYASSFRWFDYWFDTECGSAARTARETTMKRKAEQHKKKTM